MAGVPSSPPRACVWGLRGGRARPGTCQELGFPGGVCVLQVGEHREGLSHRLSHRA